MLRQHNLSEIQYQQLLLADASLTARGHNQGPSQLNLLATASAEDRLQAVTDDCIFALNRLTELSQSSIAIISDEAKLEIACIKAEAKANEGIHKCTELNEILEIGKRYAGNVKDNNIWYKTSLYGVILQDKFDDNDENAIAVLKLIIKENTDQHGQPIATPYAIGNLIAAKYLLANIWIKRNDTENLDTAYQFLADIVNQPDVTSVIPQHAYKAHVCLTRIDYSILLKQLNTLDAKAQLITFSEKFEKLNAEDQDEFKARFDTNGELSYLLYRACRLRLMLLEMSPPKFENLSKKEIKKKLKQITNDLTASAFCYLDNAVELDNPHALHCIIMEELTLAEPNIEKLYSDLVTNAKHSSESNLFLFLLNYKIKERLNNFPNTGLLYNYLEQAATKGNLFAKLLKISFLMMQQGLLENEMKITNEADRFKAVAYRITQTAKEITDSRNILDFSFLDNIQLRANQFRSETLTQLLKVKTFFQPSPLVISELLRGTFNNAYVGFSFQVEEMMSAIEELLGNNKLFPQILARVTDSLKGADADKAQVILNKITTPQVKTNQKQQETTVSKPAIAKPQKIANNFANNTKAKPKRTRVKIDFTETKSELDINDILDPKRKSNKPKSNTDILKQIINSEAKLSESRNLATVAEIISTESSEPKLSGIQVDSIYANVEKPIVNGQIENPVDQPAQKIDSSSNNNLEDEKPVVNFQVEKPVDQPAQKIDSSSNNNLEDEMPVVNSQVEKPLDQPAQKIDSSSNNNLEDEMPVVNSQVEKPLDQPAQKIDSSSNNNLKVEKPNANPQGENTVDLHVPENDSISTDNLEVGKSIVNAQVESLVNHHKNQEVEISLDQMHTSLEILECMNSMLVHLEEQHTQIPALNLLNEKTQTIAKDVEVKPEEKKPIEETTIGPQQTQSSNQGNQNELLYPPGLGFFSAPRQYYSIFFPHLPVSSGLTEKYLNKPTAQTINQFSNNTSPVEILSNFYTDHIGYMSARMMQMQEAHAAEILKLKQENELLKQMLQETTKHCIEVIMNKPNEADDNQTKRNTI